MEQLQFKVSSAIKDLIGKDLIVDDNIAIFELVKNSYDAYASKVVITFEHNKIIISDNGKGMSLPDINNKWIFLGFSAKRDGSEDSYTEKQNSYRDNIKRHYAGAKGIGRFSCDRLGKNLVMTTKSQLSNTTEIIYIDWSLFEADQGAEFTNISINHEATTNMPIFPQSGKTGTILEITNLHDNNSWGRDKILNLKRSLEKLINPFSETNDFSIEIVCSYEKETDNEEKNLGKFDRDIVNGIIKNSISDILNLKTTQIDVELLHDRIITTITDRGEKIYTIKEYNTKFKNLSNVKIGLYFLNRAAKYNFSKLMGVAPINYGSIFLFRNGFRIMPFGSPKDDSWNLDYRAQQGHNRYIGTRDLFGRVDVITDKIDDLKEVSSRDGGLIMTTASEQLFNLFSIAHRRLERYVVGVLWGEAFLKKEYFHNEAEALKARTSLLEKDKDNDTPNYILESSIGSKIDFIQLIKTLSKDKDIEVLYYNKDLANIISDPMESWSVKPQFISDLEKIAIQTDDANLLYSIDEAKARIVELQKEKDEAEKRAYDSEQRRIEAEQKARIEEALRIEAEKRRKEEEVARVNAQLKAKEADIKRREEEVLRKEAEQKRKEEQERRKIAESERDVEISKNKYLAASRNITKETADLLHTVKLSSMELSSAAKSIQYSLDEPLNNNQIREELDVIFFHIERIEKISKLLTKADIALLKEHSKVDVSRYIKEYVENYKASVKDIVVEIKYDTPVIKKLPLLDLTVIIDNLISNSVKADATKIYIEFKREESKIIMDFSDNGRGVDMEVNTVDSIFELGITNRRGGSGIGLSTIRDIMRKEVKGEITFIGNCLHFESGATFRITF